MQLKNTYIVIVIAEIVLIKSSGVALCLSAALNTTWMRGGLMNIRGVEFVIYMIGKAAVDIGGCLRNGPIDSDPSS
jgi:hypothetical protein